MSKPAGSGYSEREYDRRKQAHDFVVERLRKSGVSDDKAREKARQIANETDNKRKQQGKE